MVFMFIYFTIKIYTVFDYRKFETRNRSLNILAFPQEKSFHFGAGRKPDFVNKTIVTLWLHFVVNKYNKSIFGQNLRQQKKILGG